MDELLRERAKQAIARAKQLESYYYSNEEVLKVYLKGVNCYLEIVNKTASDYFAISKNSHSIATIYFNAKNHAKAAEYYVSSIQHLLKTELDDSAYRTLTEHYIDLADACYELYNQPAGNEAMGNAINAFKAIKEKTEEETAIGDPVTNFTQFHQYYELKLSTRSYVKSTKFKNHAQLLSEQQQALSEQQQEQALMAQFSGISIGEQQQLDTSIEAMLNQLSLAEPQQASFFTPTLFSPVPDSTYRKTAQDFLRIAQSHVKTGAVGHVISTYQQAIGALRSIPKPAERDLQIIQELTQQISFLKTKPQQALNAASASSILFNSSSTVSEDVEMGGLQFS